MKKLNTKTLVSLAFLVAIEVILARFLSINTWNIRIGFAFVPVAVSAIWYGPIHAGIVAVLADILGAVLFPTGPFFPGFTLTAFLTGVVFGLLLHKKFSTFRVLIAVCINQLVLGLLLNTLWINMLYGGTYLAIMTTRLLQCAVLLPVQFLVIRAIEPVCNKFRRIVSNEI